MLKKLRRFKNDSSGQSAVIVAIALIVLLGFSAFAVDIGYAAHQKSVLQNTADSAALAGAMSIRSSNGNDAVVESKVVEYVNANMENPASIDGIIINRVNNSIEVSLSQETPKFFAGVISSETKDMEASATAKTWIEGEALPFINLDDNYTTGGSITLWDKLKYGDFERLWADITKDDTNCIVRYDNGVFFDEGVVANIKKYVQYCYDQGKDVYVYSLKNNLITIPVEKVGNKQLFEENKLVLLRVHITDITLNGNKRGIEVNVKEVITDFANDLPNARADGESKAILIE